MAHMMILLVKNDLEKLNQGKGLFKVTSILFSGYNTASSLLVNQQFDLHESARRATRSWDYFFRDKIEMTRIKKRFETIKR